MTALAIDRVALRGGAGVSRRRRALARLRRVDPVAPGAPTETVTIYGAGSATIRFNPWLRGTAGLKLNSDGSMEVKGKVALPDSSRSSQRKNLRTS